MRISIIFGVIGIVLIIVQICSNVTVTDLNKLIGKTDTVMTSAIAQSKVSDSLLHLNLEIAKSNESADKSRFIASLFRVGANLMYKDSAMKLESHEEEKEAQEFKNRMIPIFESQMNNPFLCKDGTMVRLWVNANAHLNILRHEGDYSRSYSKEYDISSDNRIDDLTNTELYGNFMTVWQSVDTALLYCSQKMKLKKHSYLKN